MIHKWLREGMSKSAIAKRLGISRETVRKYALKPEGYIPECIYRRTWSPKSETLGQFM